MDLQLLSPLLLVSIAVVASVLWILLSRLSSKIIPVIARGKLPPGPQGWPIFGNLLQLGPFPHKDLARFSTTYGPLVYLRLGAVDVITTDNPDVVREIFLGQDDVFASRPRTQAGVHILYGCGDIALAPLGPKWKRMKRVCVEHLLTSKHLNSFSAQRAQEAQNIVRDIWARAEGGEPVDLKDVLSAFSMNNVTRMMLGKKYLGTEAMVVNEEASEFVEVAREILRLMGMVYPGDYLPIWRFLDLFRCEKSMKAVGKKIDVLLQRIIEEHRMDKVSEDGDGNDDGGGMDFVDVLLSLGMDDVEIKALVLDMIVASIDTSTVTSEWAMTEMMKNPRVLRKAQEELDTMVGTDRMVEESDLAHLTYLRCVVRETFRMHPPAPFLIPRESVRPTKLMGFDIPSKARLFINTYALGRNPGLWAKPDEFRPERHLPEDGKRVELSHGSEFWILPFGAGMRKCPGTPFGSVLVQTALARLLHCFEWSLPDGLRTEDVDTEEVYGLTMPKAKPLMAKAKQRLAPHHYYS